MNKWKLLSILLVGFLVASFIVRVDARGGVFPIEPMQEVIDSIELTVSDKTSADVCGDVSVVDGFIDFYVTSPSGIILLCYNKTAFNSFNFVVKENGTYLIHLVNTWSTSNVTVTLDYGVNWEIILQEAVTMHWQTAVTTETVFLEPSTSINILEILQIIYFIIMIVSGILGILGVKLYILRKKKVEYIREFGIMKKAQDTKLLPQKISGARIRLSVKGIRMEKENCETANYRKVMRFLDLYWLLKKIIDLLMAEILKKAGWYIYERFLHKPLQCIYKKIFKTYQFVGWEINGQIVSTRNPIEINITRKTNMLAIYKLLILAPFWRWHYRVKIKTRPVFG